MTPEEIQLLEKICSSVKDWWIDRDTRQSGQPLSLWYDDMQIIDDISEYTLPEIVKRMVTEEKQASYETGCYDAKKQIRDALGLRP